MYSKPRLFGVFSLVVYAIAAPAFACDITQLDCWDSGKCNIEFKNHTGDASGDASGTPISQSSAAQTIKVKAMTSGGDKVGNQLTITSSAKNTMNIENKYEKGFDKIRVSSTNGITEGFDLSCSMVKAILDGNGTCKVFHGTTSQSSNTYVLGYSCDGGDVDGPSYWD